MKSIILNLRFSQNPIPVQSILSSFLQCECFSTYRFEYTLLNSKNTHTIVYNVFVIVDCFFSIFVPPHIYCCFTWMWFSYCTYAIMFELRSSVCPFTRSHRCTTNRNFAGVLFNFSQSNGYDYRWRWQFNELTARTQLGLVPTHFILASFIRIFPLVCY